MREFEYKNPAQNKERAEQPRHTFELKDENGFVVAGAEIDYYSKPIPYYQITDIWVDFEEKGKGIASDLMARIEQMLNVKKRAGFLVDAIIEGDPAKGFYERRGWVPVPGGRDQYVYNLPAGVSPDIFVGVEFRQTPIEERENHGNVGNGAGNGAGS